MFMRRLQIFCALIIIVFLLCSVSEAANWTIFFKSAARYDFYYDKDSITYTKENTVLVWYKVVPQKEAKIKAWIEALELREVDCMRKSYKTLQGKTVYGNKPMKIKKETSWIYFEPDDLDTAFYKTICKEEKE